MPTTRRKSKAPTPQAPELSDSAVRVLRRFRIVVNSVKSHFRTVEKRAGISGAQAWALSVIREQPGIGVSGLAQAMDVHQSTASNLLRPLLEQGLVLAGRAEADKRAVRLQLSPAGTRVLKKAPGPFTGVLPQALMELDERTLARLDRDLGRLIEVLGADSKAGEIPLWESTR
jgi:DNA-binding MarR family transcriptional regulator